MAFICSIALFACSSTQTNEEAIAPQRSQPTAITGGSCNPKVGSKVPDLIVDSLNTNNSSASATATGSKVKIERGKVTLVDFWATWCLPCEASFPKYQELYTKYRAQGFEIIAIAMDDSQRDIPSFVKRSGAKFPVGWDSGHAVADCWKPPVMPTAYIIDKKGVVRHIHNKWEPGSEKAIEAQLKALL